MMIVPVSFGLPLEDDKLDLSEKVTRATNVGADSLIIYVHVRSFDRTYRTALEYTICIPYRDVRA